MNYLPEIHSLPWRRSTQCLSVSVSLCVRGVVMCENIPLGVLLYVCVGARVCVLSSSEQSSGNVWVTHEEMENLASSTKAVSTIWVLPTPSPAHQTTLTHRHCPHRDTHMSTPGRPLYISTTSHTNTFFVLVLGLACGCHVQSVIMWSELIDDECLISLFMYLITVDMSLKVNCRVTAHRKALCVCVSDVCVICVSNLVYCLYYAATQENEEGSWAQVRLLIC